MREALPIASNPEGVDVAALHEVVERVAYPGLDLPRSVRSGILDR